MYLCSSRILKTDECNFCQSIKFFINFCSFGKGVFTTFFYHLCFGVWDTLWSSFLLRRWFSGFDLCFSKILGSSTNCLRTIWGDDHSQKQLERQFLISTLIYHWWENSLKRHQSAKKTYRIFKRDIFRLDSNDFLAPKTPKNRWLLFWQQRAFFWFLWQCRALDFMMV